jgi:hypothetical protein
MSNVNNSNDERGAVVVIVAVCMIMLIGFLGLAADAGYAYLQKTRLQSVADAEALACVVSPNSAPCPVSGGDVYPAVNPYGFNVTILNPGDASFCQTSMQTGCAQATVQTTWNTFFIGLLGFKSLNLSATAVAGKNGNIPSCIITTGDFSANGNNQVGLNNCAATIGGSLSTTHKAGITITGLGTISVFNGGNANQCGTCVPNPVSVSTPIPELPSSVFPTKNLDGVALPTLPYTSCKNSACIPAIYTGGQVTLNANTTLQSGNYVFNGGFSNAGYSLTSGAGGVSLYVAGNQTLSLTGTVNLTAPSAVGCKAGSEMVISHPYVSSYNSISLHGSNVNLCLNGVVNLSADNVTVGGSSANLNITGSFVAHSIRLNGNMYPQISSNPCFNFYESTGAAILVN